MILLAIIMGLFFLPMPARAECPVEWAHPDCCDGNPFNGYFWKGKFWVPGYISNSTWFTPAPIVSKGNATFYGPGVMEATAEYRGFVLEGYVDGITLMSPADIGAEVWLKAPDREWEGPFLVVDCARRGDIWPVINFYGGVIELGFKTAERWGMVEQHSRWTAIRWKERDVLVSKVPPSSVDRYEVIDYSQWWVSMAEFTHRRESRPLYRYPSTWRINGVWHTFDHTVCHEDDFVLKLRQQSDALPSYINLKRRKSK